MDIGNLGQVVGDTLDRPGNIDQDRFAYCYR
jgi:hypothetical protein